MARAPSGSARIRSATVSAVSFETTLAQVGHTVRPTLANRSRRWSWISVAVATVDRGLRAGARWRMATAGQMPSIESSAGLSIRSRNWRA